MNIIKKTNIQNGFVNLITNQYYFLLSLFFLLIFVMTNGHMGVDEGVWSYIGRVWCENNIPPYVGTVENKTPGIFELYAISHILFGTNYFFVRILGSIAILFSSWTIYLIGKELYTPLAGIFSMVIFGLTMTWHLLHGVYTAQTETFMVLFSTLSFYFIIKGAGSRKWKQWVVLSGFSMGLAITFKQIALTTTLALIFFFILYAATNLTNKNKLLGLILLGLGIFISTLFTFIPLLVSGVSLKDYIDGAWLILMNQGSSASIMLHIENFIRVWLNSRLVIFYPFLCLIVFQPDLVKNKCFIGLLIWMLFDFLGVNASGRYFGHQIKQLIPSLSIIFGVLLSNLLMIRISEKSIISKYATIVLISLIILLFPYKSLLQNTYKVVTGYSNKSMEIGKWLRDNTNEEDYVYIAGTGSGPILSYSGRVSSSKYLNIVFVTSAVERQLLLSDLEAKPPLYFLKQNSFIGLGEKIEGFIINNYTLLNTKYGYEVLKLNSL